MFNTDPGSGVFNPGSGLFNPELRIRNTELSKILLFFFLKKIVTKLGSMISNPVFFHPDPGVNTDTAAI
jgi:hypothetical protein